VTRDELKRVVADVLEIDPSELASDTELKRFDTFDSVSVLSLMIDLDEKAGIRLGPGEAAALTRFGDIEALADQQGIELTD
jgi:acyl carrier protein